MKSILRILFIIVFFASGEISAQHANKIVAILDAQSKTIAIKQQLQFNNQTGDVLHSIVLNDWNHAYSSKKTPLAKRFSDEFVRSFHLAKAHERGSTNNLAVYGDSIPLPYLRTAKQPDIIEVQLKKPLLPGESIALHFSYSVKVPSAKFTRYGYNNDGSFNLKYWFLSPARYSDHKFARYSNSNVDDIANGVSDIDLELTVPITLSVVSDLNETAKTDNLAASTYFFSGKDRNDFSLFIEPASTFHSFKNKLIEVRNGLNDKKVSDVEKAIIVDRIVTFVNENVGEFPNSKITVSQDDYDRNPFYGLNQLPSFISPFSDDFLFEIKFLKTYLNNYLKASMRLDPRKDNWIYDGIQVYTMMKYIDEFRPDSKMMGGLSQMKLLKNYRLVNLSFNDQYSYLYMLMARKNLDQPLGDPKNTLIKFNEQIAGKYRAGLSLRYLDDYLNENVVPSSIAEFYSLNKQRQVDRSDFESILKNNTTNDIDWFFETIIDSRKIIDYKFTDVLKNDSTVVFTLRNKTGTTVPIPVYGVKKGEVVFKHWIDNVSADSTITVARNDADKVVLNLKNEVPEYNQRNNWRSLKGFSLSNRPLRFNVMKDLEDPDYNQILYVPTMSYNLYDGVSPGLRFHNKTILEKPFVFEINPAYSTNRRSLTGSFNFTVNENYREGALYNVRYSMSGSYFHYAPDAAYTKLTPIVQLRFREPDYRNNRRKTILLREVIVHRQPTSFIIDGSETFQDYAVFNARFVDSKTEVIKHFSYVGDLQLSQQFGKFSAETEYRKLFEDNRQFNLRVYAGTFLYNKTSSDFFSFALDRPTDYMFDYSYYGRSEDTGIYSQEFIMAEGGFKSKLDTPFANQWITTANLSYSIWNWIEVYGDVGLIKNRNINPAFVYDSGIRLNLVTDYLELFFPVYSNNGWEIGDKNYQEKIRFTLAFSPRTLVNLFTRKWF